MTLVLGKGLCFWMIRDVLSC